MVAVMGAGQGGNMAAADPWAAQSSGQNALLVDNIWNQANWYTLAHSEQ